MTKTPMILTLCLLMVSATITQAQSAAPAAIPLRPEVTDSTSHKLIKNHLAVSGGKSAHIDLKSVTATGTITEAGKIKSFELIEMLDGRRQLTYSWRLLGRDYKTLYSYDGVRAWKQELLPEKQLATALKGRDALHFARQHWLIHPFTVPQKADYIFTYQGTSKVSGRPAYVVNGHGQNGQHSWFYFDKEKSLLTRWGGKGTIGGIEKNMDYRTSRFTTVNGVLLPKEIDLLAENSKFGTITVQTITANKTIDAKIFYMPPDMIPKLSQQTSR